MGEEAGKDFYFVEMAYSRLLVSIVLHNLLKYKITLFLLGYSFGELVNEIVFRGDADYLEFIISILALIFITVKSNDSAN